MLFLLSFIISVLIVMESVVFHQLDLFTVCLTQQFPVCVSVCLCVNVCVSCANRARVTLSNVIELSSQIEYLRRILMLGSVAFGFAIDRRIFPVLTTTVSPCLAPGVLYHSQLFLSVFEYRQPKINCTISFWELFDLCSFCTLSIFCPDVGLYFYAFRAASWYVVTFSLRLTNTPKAPVRRGGDVGRQIQPTTTRRLRRR